MSSTSAQVQATRSVESAANDLPGADLPDAARNPQAASPDSVPARSLSVVAIGGGTGLSTLLRGLKRYVTTPAGSLPLSNSHCAEDRDGQACMISDLAAVVTVTDDGGSSGRLREDFQMLPPGDIRNCMVALSEDEHLLSKLFQFRFGSGDLSGHSFGNLFVAALSSITGDFAQAVQMSSQILATRGRIFPVTNQNVHLAARMDDGSVVEGETNITASTRRILQLMLKPADAAPLPETIDAIAHADLITLGPGSLYTSLITNLLVRGLPEALVAARGKRVFICNLMTQANESIGLSAAQHLERIFNHANQTHEHALPSGEHSNQEDAAQTGRAHRPIFDYALINTAPISPDLLEKYAAEGQEPIEADLDRVRALGVEPVTGDFVHEGSVLRHDYDKVAEALLALALRP